MYLCAKLLEEHIRAVANRGRDKLVAHVRIICSRLDGGLSGSAAFTKYAEPRGFCQHATIEAVFGWIEREVRRRILTALAFVGLIVVFVFWHVSHG